MIEGSPLLDAGRDPRRDRSRPRAIRLGATSAERGGVAGRRSERQVERGRWTSCAPPTNASRPARPSVRAALRRGRRRRRRRHAAHPLRRRGPADGEVVLLLHGEPSWSYLYRKMIPVLVARASVQSRPTWSASAAATSRPSRDDYTLPAPRRLDAGPLFDSPRSRRHHPRVPGLGRPHRAAPRRRAPRRFARVVAANTFLPTGDTPPGRRVPRLAALLARPPRLRRRRASSPWAASPSSRPRSSPPTTRRSPTTRYKAGRAPVPDARAHDVPTTPPRRPTATRGSRCDASSGRSSRAFSDSDPITRGADGTAQRDPGRGRSAAHHDHRRRPLPPGGPRRSSSPRVVARFVADTPA